MLYSAYRNVIESDIWLKKVLDTYSTEPGTDLCNTEFGQVIIDNSSYLFVMAQGQKEIEAVQKMMNLSESEKQFLTTASQGNGLLVVGQDTRLPIQVQLREEEKYLFGSAGGK